MTFFLDWGVPLVVTLDAQEFSLTASVKAQLLQQLRAILASPYSSSLVKKNARSLALRLEMD